MDRYAQAASSGRLILGGPAGPFVGHGPMLGATRQSAPLDTRRRHRRCKYGVLMCDLRCPLACLLALALSLAGIGKVAAQQSTTATYDDWVLQCQSSAGPTPQKICDIAQVTEVQGKNLPVSRVAISRPAKGQPFRLVVQVPVNVSLRANVLIKVNQSDPGLAAPFDRCLPGGCFADFELKEDVIKKFLGGTAAGKITFKTANEQTATIPISFKGFAQAFDALIKQ